MRLGSLEQAIYERVLGRSVIAVCKKTLYNEVTESSSWVSELLMKTVCLQQLKEMQHFKPGMQKKYHLGQ